MSFVNIFEHSISCHFVSLIISFALQKLLVWCGPFVFGFVALARGDRSSHINKITMTDVKECTSYLEVLWFQSLHLSFDF